MASARLGALGGAKASAGAAGARPQLGPKWERRHSLAWAFGAMGLTPKEGMVGRSLPTRTQHPKDPVRPMAARSERPGRVEVAEIRGAERKAIGWVCFWGGTREWRRRTFKRNDVIAGGKEERMETGGVDEGAVRHSTPCGGGNDKSSGMHPARNLPFGEISVHGGKGKAVCLGLLLQGCSAAQRVVGFPSRCCQALCFFTPPVQATSQSLISVAPGGGKSQKGPKVPEKAKRQDIAPARPCVVAPYAKGKWNVWGVVLAHKWRKYIPLFSSPPSALGQGTFFFWSSADISIALRAMVEP